MNSLDRFLVCTIMIVMLTLIWILHVQVNDIEAYLQKVECLLELKND